MWGSITKGDSIEYREKIFEKYLGGIKSGYNRKRKKTDGCGICVPFL